MQLIPLPDNLAVNVVVIVLAFGVLSFCADFLVDGAVGIAQRLRVPKIVIGIVLVGFATTSPELTVSLLAALRGHPELALGNAIGSVIVDDAVALGLGIVVAPVAIAVDSKVLKTTGLFLAAVAVVSFALAANGTVSRLEGVALLVIHVAYLTAVLIAEGRRRRRAAAAGGEPAAAGAGPEDAEAEAEDHGKPGGLGIQVLRLAGGVAGIVLASELLVESATFVARVVGASEAIIGLTIIAIGTSLPEIATSISASRRGHGDLALGNILGADILNLLWIIGASALANPIRVDRDIVFFSFPWMLLIVGTMLLLCRIGYRLPRWKGLLLVGLYLIYLTMTIVLFYLNGA